MRLLAPEWLLLIPLLAVVGWRRPGWGWARPRRVAWLAGWVLVLAHPEIRRRGDGLDVWVLVDRSASARSTVAARRREWEALMEQARGPGDRLRFVDFAETTRIRDDGAVEAFADPGTETRIASALRHVLAEVDPRRNTRLLLLTDGYGTEPLTGLAERLSAARIPLDVRLVSSGSAADVLLGPLSLPSRALVGEPFLVEAHVVGTRDQPVKVVVYRDGSPVGSGRVDVTGGQGTIRFADRVARPGGVRYRIMVSAPQDPHPDNNWAEHWIEVQGGPRILLVSGYQDDPVADLLRRLELQVEVVTDPSSLHAGRVSGARAVILHNIPAHRLPPDFLKALPFYVQQQGGGLWMIGGEHSFGSGGYFESAIDPLLPVSMELKEDHRKWAMALAIVLDRSGSMSAGVPGAPGLTKMDLANQGAARTIELLGAHDLVAVWAVDSAAHAVIPLSPVGSHRNELLDRVRRIQSGGGGIFVYEGLQAAWGSLRDAGPARRHLILFSDAADSEHPGAYRSLLEEMTAVEATVSVIGLGREEDTDGDLLKEIAARGRGRIFFNQDPRDLPVLFAQEVVAVARSAFIREPVSVIDAGGWLELAPRPLDWPTAVDAYNLSYLRPSATAGALTGDDERAPLAAWWRRGLGRVAAVSFPLAGAHADVLRGWNGTGDFVQTVARWCLADEAPPGVRVRTSLVGTDLQVDLFHDETWQLRAETAPPELWIERMKGTGAVAWPWERCRPGHYRASIRLPARQSLRGVVKIGQVGLPFGPVTAGSDAEWSFRPQRRTELQELSVRSGGEERANLAGIWKAPRRPVYEDARPWLYVLLLGLLVADAWRTRFGGERPVTVGARRPAGPARARTGPKPAASTGPPDAVPAGPETASDVAGDRRRARLAQAKRRGP